MAVSGAMKLTTLSDVSIDTNPLPYPELLIDVALSLDKVEHVCYFLNPIVVLDRATRQTDYRRNEINDFYNNRIDQLKNFVMPDDGYSTLTSGSLLNYAQIKATNHQKEGDIHAAHILAWAITLLVKTIDIDLDWIEPPT